MPLKDILTEFTNAAAAHVNSGAQFSHKVFRGTLKGSEKTWIRKEMPDPAVAKIEILAQEFFRLIIPHQGETRLLENKTNGTYYILSEEVKGYRNLPENEATNFTNGQYSGLGQVLICSMFVQEIDLKNGNLGLDAQGRVAKIDGDWCFAEGRFGEGKYGLTPKAIAALPYPTDFYVFNWLDLVVSGTASVGSNIVGPELVDSPQLRTEINQAMLMISLMPDCFIGHFVDAYMPSGGERFVNLLKARRDNLQKSAAENLSFQAYLKSEQAMVDAENFVRHMNSFQANGEAMIVPVGERERISNEVNVRLADLKCSVALLYKVNESDVVLQNHIDLVRQRLRDNLDNPGQLAIINKELTNILSSVSSLEVIAVRQAAKSLRDNAHWYTRKKMGKADRIEEALCRIPLEERGRVITQAGSNPVQEALASHRNFGKSGRVYKIGEEVDVKKAAQTFKELKTQFSQMTRHEDDVADDVSSTPPLNKN